MLIAAERGRRIDRAQMLERLAEQELLLGHERNAERLSGDAAELRDLTTTTTTGRPSGEPMEH
ncbi:MAG: hypothetical protein ACRYHQ_32160 [Janthinobacterium lividum]